MTQRQPTVDSLNRDPIATVRPWINRPGFSSGLGAVRREFEPARLLPNLVAGGVVSVIVVIVSVSLATLIFADGLAPRLPEGISIMLFSGVIVTGFIAATSSYRGMIAAPQERVAPILALAAAAIATQLPANTSPDVLFYTVVAMLCFTAVLNGTFLLCLGYFRLGALVRFIPYPVIGGFLAGTGWLLVSGSVGVMVGRHIHPTGIPELLLDGEMIAKWAPGVGFGLLLTAVSRRTHYFLVLPGLLTAGVAIFYAVVALGVEGGIARMETAGWLLGPFPAGGEWRPLSVPALMHADWSAVFSQMGSILTILFVTVVSVLLNSSALELVTHTDVDLNRELKASGAANLAVGLAGGSVGFHSLSISRLALQIGTRSRMVGLIAAAVCAALVFIGIGPLAYLPRFVLGGILFFLGMHFLIEWLYDAWFRLIKADYFIVLLILAAVASLGYLHGVVVGIIACIILFLVNYSRVHVVKHALTGVEQRSNVDRPSRHQGILDGTGAQLAILKLQGFIFFGTANRLLERVRTRCLQRAKVPLRFMLLDFGAVTGVDSSSLLSFVKMRQLAAQRRFTLVFCRLSPALKKQLAQEGFNSAPAKAYRSFRDLDHALEFCEDEILAPAMAAPVPGDDFDLRRQLGATFRAGGDIDRLLGYFERIEVPAGQAIIVQDAASDTLFLVEHGQVSATLRNGQADGELRLHTMAAGSIIGELGFILGGRRTATITADRPSVLNRLTAAGLERMRSEAPEIAVGFESHLNRLLAARLVQANRVIKSLLE